MDILRIEEPDITVRILEEFCLELENFLVPYFLDVVTELEALLLDELLVFTLQNQLII